MSAKLSLKLEYQSPFVTMALHSSLRGYRMAWTINNNFDLDLVRTTDFPFLVNDKEVMFALFSYYCNKFRMRFLLIENKNPEGKIISKAPIPDYLLLIWNKSEYFDVESFQVNLKKCHGLQAAYPLDDKLKQKNSAFFHDFEFFLEASEKTP